MLVCSISSFIFTGFILFYTILLAASLLELFLRWAATREPANVLLYDICSMYAACFVNLACGIVPSLWFYLALSIVLELSLASGFSQFETDCLYTLAWLCFLENPATLKCPLLSHKNRCPLIQAASSEYTLEPISAI